MNKNFVSERSGCSFGEYDTGRVIDDKKSYTFPNDGYKIEWKTHGVLPVCPRVIDLHLATNSLLLISNSQS